MVIYLGRCTLDHSVHTILGHLTTQREIPRRGRAAGAARGRRRCRAAAQRAGPRRLPGVARRDARRGGRAPPAPRRTVREPRAVDLDQAFTKCPGSGQPALVLGDGQARCSACAFTYWTAMDAPVTAEHAWGEDGRTVRIGTPRARAPPPWEALSTCASFQGHRAQRDRLFQAACSKHALVRVPSRGVPRSYPGLVPITGRPSPSARLGRTRRLSRGGPGCRPAVAAPEWGPGPEPGREAGPEMRLRRRR